MNNITFYIDTSKSPNNNPVQGLTNNTPDDSILTFVSGDKIPVSFIFVNGGDYDSTVAVTSSLSSSFYLALGLPTGNTAYTSTNRFYISSSQYMVTASLDLSVGGVTGSFSSTDDYIQPTLQLSLFNPSGSTNRRTLMMKKVKVLNAVDS